MAVPSAYLPQFILQDGRWEYSTIDTNNNLVVWPNTLGGVYDLTQRSGQANATHTVTAGPDVGTAVAGSTANMIFVDYQGVIWGFQANTSTKVPSWINSILTATGSPYTVT